CFLRGAGPPRALHSFPTRRSSDLAPGGRAGTPRRSGSFARPSRSFPVRPGGPPSGSIPRIAVSRPLPTHHGPVTIGRRDPRPVRSEEHTSELQSRSDLVCRLLLEK